MDDTNIKINYSKNEINAINNNLSDKIESLDKEKNKLLDYKMELYIINLAYWLEKSKDKVVYYSLKVNNEGSEFFLDFTWSLLPKAFISQKIDVLTYEAATDHNYKILSKETRNYHLDKIVNNGIKIYPNDDILLKIAEFVYGSEQAGLWVNKKRLELLNDDLNANIPEKEIVKKMKI